MRPMTLLTTPVRLCLLALAALTLAACDDSSEKNVAQLMERAAERRAAGELRSTIIELKTVLQKEPKNAAARLLLGQVYLDSGNASAAEKEMAIAEKLGAPRLPLLEGKGKAWLMQGKIEEILREYQPDDKAPAAVQAIVLKFRGQALFAQNNLDEAEANFELAQQAYITDLEKERPHLKITEPSESVDAIIGITRIAIRRSDWKRAEALLSRLLELAPKSPEVLATKGSIALNQRKYKEAESAFQAALDGQPISATLRIELAKAQIGGQRPEEAIKNLDHVLKAFPNHPYSNYLRSLAAYRTGDYEGAKKYADVVFKTANKHVPTNLIAGASSYALGQLEQALKHLTYYISQDPLSEDARQLLGATQLRLGQTSEAVVTLRPLEGKSQDDVRLLKLIGTAALNSGDFVSSKLYFEKAIALKPSDASAQAGAGMALIALGQQDSGIERLEAAVQSDNTLKDAEINLVRTYFRAKQYKKVVEVARRIQERSPEQASGYTLEGLAQMALQKPEDAQKLFRKALEVDPENLEAANNMAKVHLLAKDFDKARQLYTKSLKANPGELKTLLRLAALEGLSGDIKRARSWLEQAVEANPDSAEAMTRLARIYMGEGRAAKAFGLVARADKLLPNTPAILEVMGHAQLGSDRAKDALITFIKLSKLQPESAAVQSAIIRAASIARNGPRMKEALDTLIKLAPSDKDAKMARARVAIGERDLELGGKLLGELKAVDPDSPVVLELDANLAMFQERWEDAIVAFRRLNAVLQTTRDVVRLSEVQWLSGKQQDAIATLKSWLIKYPEDQVSRFKLGVYYQQLGQLENAKDAYATFVAAHPDEVKARNNLAWVSYRLGDLSGARTHAEKAIELAPNNPIPMDTLGIILLKSGENKKSIQLLRAASARLPDDPTVGFHLVQAMVANGETEQAFQRLKAILESQNEFLDRDKATALLKQLEK